MLTEPAADRRTATETAEETPFYIAARGAIEQARRVLKHGDTFAVFNGFGDVGALGTGEDGVFHCDTRHLSRFEFNLNGSQPLLLGSNVRDDNLALTVDLTNPDFYIDKKLVLPKDAVHIIRSIFLWDGTAHQRLGVRNFGEQSIELTCSFFFASDFFDLFEVRGMRRARRGEQRVALDGRSAVVFEYKGLDGKSRRTRLVFDPPPAMLANNVASYTLKLRPDERVSMFCAATCSLETARSTAPFFKAMRAGLRDRKEQTSGITTVETSNDIFNEVLCRSAADLDMLVTMTAQGRYPYAGIPWYSTTFGRDGLITAIELLWCDPLSRAACSADWPPIRPPRTNAESDAEPGKILHEMRSGEMAALHEVPFSLYYGSVDSTPLFVMLACLYTERTGDEETLRSLWPHIEAALAWIDGPADADRRRLCRVSPRDRAGARQSRLEGFAGRDLSCRRAARRRSDRAGRGAGLCLCRQAPRRPRRAPARPL